MARRGEPGPVEDLLSRLPEPGVVGYTLAQVSPDPSGRARTLPQCRLFRKTLETRWRYRVHEQVRPSLRGQVLDAGIALAHDGYADPVVLAEKGRRNARLIARDLADHPADPVVLFHAGVAALDAKRPAEAARLFDRSRRLIPASPVAPPLEDLYSGLARALALGGDPSQALAACREGLAQLPENPELLFVAGTLLFQAGETAAAESQLRHAITERPTHGLAWQVLTDLLLSGRRRDEARTLAAQLRAIPGMAVDAAVCGARVELARGEAATALRTLDDAIAACPRALLLLHELQATVLLHLKDEAGAQAVFARLLTLDPGHAWARRMRAEHRPAPNRSASISVTT